VWAFGDASFSGLMINYGLAARTWAGGYWRGYRVRGTFLPSAMFPGEGPAAPGRC
jgi:hypothetical protein